MVKRTLYFGNQAYLSCRDAQLVLRTREQHLLATVPIEDIGVLVLDHPQITVTHTLLDSLLQHNVAVITCDQTHLPKGLLLNLSGHREQSRRFRQQIEASQPLKKQLWQNTIRAKIDNQAALLERHGVVADNLRRWAGKVRSGDPDNLESRAAVSYWPRLFAENALPEPFTRERYGPPPNAWLNYGYAILRAMTARALVGSGLLPTLGIFHHGKYNDFCLADDIMEPYRPFVDGLVKEALTTFEVQNDLSKDLKAHLLKLAALDVDFPTARGKYQTRPLMVALQLTTAGLARSFTEGKALISYPRLK